MIGDRDVCSCGGWLLRWRGVPSEGPGGVEELKQAMRGAEQ